jgi:type II secretory pathway component PulK
MPMSRSSDEHGVVLLLVLVILVASISTVYAFTRTTTLEVLSSRQRSEHVRAELLAASGKRIAVRALLHDLDWGEDLTRTLESERDDWALLSRAPIQVPGGGILRIGITDGGARINLNALVDSAGELHPPSRVFLTTALERIIDAMPGRAEDKAYDVDALAVGILDWIDIDDQTASFGDDEIRTYGRIDPDALPLDRPVFSIDELIQVPGMDTLLLEAIKDYFTSQPMYPAIEKSGVNPNTAPAHVLGLVYHFQGSAAEGRLFDRDDVFRILRFREEGRIFCRELSDEDCESFEEYLEIFGDVIFPPLQFASNVFEIDIEASYGETRACVSSVIDRTDSEVRTLAYRMDC